MLSRVRLTQSHRWFCEHACPTQACSTHVCVEEATSTGSTSHQLSQWCSFWGASCRSSTTNGFQNVAYCLTAASGRNNSRNFEASAIFLFTWDRCGYRSARSHQKTFSTCETVARMKWCESRSYCSFPPASHRLRIARPLGKAVSVCSAIKACDGVCLVVLVVKGAHPANGSRSATRS